MNRFLRFFSSKPSPSIGSLLTFLQQCQAHGGHIISSPVTFSDDNRKRTLNALLKPLRLSRRDRKRLIDEYLAPLSTFTITSDDVSAALTCQNQPVFPSQVCDACAPGLFEYYGYRVADVGWCSQCHQRGECLDVALIEHYRKCGIDDRTVWRYLTRKRWGNDGLPRPLIYQSIEDIEDEHQSIFDAFESKQRLAALEENETTLPAS